MKKILIILAIFSTLVLGQTVRQNISLNAFNAGELSPLMNSRSDLINYKTGAKTLENMLVRSQGPIQRRPGTKYIATVKDSNDPVRLFPYEDSTEVSYIIEAGDEYFRFYKDGAQIADGDDPNNAYEIATPYDSNDLFEIQYAQDAQYMRFTHPNYPPCKLTCTDNDDWTMEEIDFENGPFLDENEDRTITITPSGTSSTYYDYYQLHDDSQAAVRGTSWTCQTFTASETYDINGVSLKLFRTGSPGTVTASIRATSGGEPTGNDLASGTIDGNDITTYTGGLWYDISFSSSTSLTADTAYAVVFRAISGDASNSLYWRHDSSNPTYSGGSYGSSSNSGSTWTMYTTADFMFRTTPDYDDPNYSNHVITLEATGDIFDFNHVGALWQISHIMEADSVNGETDYYTPTDMNSASLQIYERQLWDFSTHGTWSGTIAIQRSYDDGTTWEGVHPPRTYEYDGQFQAADEERHEDALYRIHGENIYGQLYYTLSSHSFIKRGVVEISSVTDSNTAESYVKDGYELGNTTATWRWAEGAWSEYRGWPRTICHHEQRCVYGGSDSYPENVWASIIIEKNEDYDNFTAGESDRDDDAWTYILPGNNPIQWILSREFLMIGTTAGIGRLGQPDKPITPTFDPTFRMQAMNGSAYIQAVPAADTILYVERGGKKVREVTYTYTSERYVAPDMTILAEHITGDGITQIAFQNRPDPILWCIREDGQLLSFTYNRHHAVESWARHTTGISDDFESAAIISGSDEDELWITALRDVNSVDHRYIELFQPLNYGSDVNDAWFVDSGTDDVNDLDHLESETVYLFGDGEADTTYIVSSGAITPGDSFTEVAIGLPYTSVFNSMPLITYTDIGSNASQRTMVQNLVLDLYKTDSFYLGTDSTNKSLQTITTPYTGLRPQLDFPRGQFREMEIYIDTNSPTPFTLRGLSCELNISYVE